MEVTPIAQCTAKSKRSGKQCRRAAVKGRSVCHFHGGRAGAPPRHGLYSHVLGEDERADYERYQDAHGALVHELAFARAKLSALERRYARLPEQPGDVTGDGSRGTSYETWDQARRQWLKIIERLELAQKQLAASDDDETRRMVTDLVDGIRRRRG